MNKNNIITVKNAEGDPDTQAEIIIQNKIDYIPKVSVIIPVYNVEEYLQECLDSVVNQTLKEIEIICVDDGSTDNSLEILKEYAQKDNRITVIMQENLHAGVARNAGLSQAKGEYVHFLDSDDWVDKNTYEELSSLIKKKKVNFMKFKSYTYDNKEKRNINNSYTDINWITEDLVISIDKKLDWAIAMSDAPWSGFYNLTFLNKNNIRFNNLKCANDVSFFINCLIKSRSFYFTVRKFVYYRINNNKSLIGVRPFNFNCQIETYHIINKIAQNEPQIIKQALKDRYSTQILMWANRYINDYRLDIKTKQNIYKLTKTFFDKNLELKCKNDFDKVYLYKVSIVIPCYNTALYLRQALDSVVNQTLKEIEIICVNDGSTDNTLDIIKEYAAKDNRIVIIDGPNGGYGKAMNKGLDKATGEYIGILEPDDYLKLDMYETQYKIAKERNLDFIKADSLRFSEENNGNEALYIYRNLSKNPSDYNTVCKPIEKQETFLFLMNTWSGIYRRDFINKFNIRHNETPGASFQDNGFFFQTFCFAERAMFLNKAFYMKRLDNPNSSVNNKNKVYCVNEEYKYIKELLIKNTLFDKVKEVYETLKFYNYMFTLTRIDNSFKLQYVIDIAEEFRKDKIEYNLSYTFFNQWDKEKIKLLMTSPANFYNKYIAENENQKIAIPKISIIIPVYNVELYLEECLDSIINQPLKEIEIICINDGSTDKSLNILEKYENKDKRIKIINQKNNGVSYARNSGLINALGEYIMFIDSDDYIFPNTLQILYDKIKASNAELLVFGGNIFPEDLPEAQWAKAVLSSPNKTYDYFDKKIIFNERSVRPCPVNKVYSSNFLRNYNFKFDTSLKLGEDQLFACTILPHITKIVFSNLKVYAYRVGRPNSAMTQNNKNLYKKLNDHIVVLNKIAEYWKKINFLDSCKIDFFEWALNFIQINNIKTFSIEERSKLASKALDLFHYFDIPLKKLSNEGKNKYKELLSCLYRTNQYKLPNMNLEFVYKDELKNWYKQIMNQDLNLNNPQTFNEKIQWMKLYNSIPIKTRLADKYLVRDWVKDTIGEKYLIPLLGVYNNFEEINFNKLPNQFVIKCNHGAAYNIIVKDKSKLNLVDTKAKLDKWMNENFAFKFGIELHYRDIPPKIIIEQYIENNGGDLVDYKFWCFNGKVEYILYCAERNITGLKMEFYDRDWNRRDFMTSPSNTKKIDKPVNLEQMIRLAEILSKDINFVRVDFYRLDDGTIYFGEMTFTPTSGTVKWLDEKYDLKFGQMIRLPNLAYNIDTGKYYEWYPEIETNNDKISNYSTEQTIKTNIQKITNTNNKSIHFPLLFKDIGFGCKTWCEPKNITGNDIKSFTYDLSDNIYTRYVSWDPIKEGSCDVEIRRLFAIEKRSKKIVEFPVNKIVSSGKIIGNKIEFRNQKGCWIGCTIEGAYESFTIEAKIKNI